MNSIQIIGNLTRDPQMRTVNMANGPVNVCSFSVAVNTRHRGQDGKPIPVYYNVSAWRGLADVCGKYLAKGRKVYVCGEPSARTYQAQDGSTRVSMEINAQDVEFLSSGNTAAQASGEAPVQVDEQTGYQVTNEDELPF